MKYDVISLVGGKTARGIVPRGALTFEKLSLSLSLSRAVITRKFARTKAASIASVAPRPCSTQFRVLSRPAASYFPISLPETDQGACPTHLALKGTRLPPRVVFEKIIGHRYTRALCRTFQKRREGELRGGWEGKKGKSSFAVATCRVHGPRHGHAELL